MISKKKRETVIEFTEILQPVSVYLCIVCVSKSSGSIVHKIPRAMKDNLLECRDFSRHRGIAGDRDVRNQ